MMVPCKRHVKATRHLLCGSCSNWVDFDKSGCEKSWAEVRADNFIFECRGYGKMKEQLRLVVAMMGREEVGCASSSGGGRGAVDDKVGEDDEMDARVSSPQPGRRLRGGRMTSHKETRRKETGRKERNETGVTKTGGKMTRVNEGEWREGGRREGDGSERREGRRWVRGRREGRRRE